MVIGIDFYTTHSHNFSTLTNFSNSLYKFTNYTYEFVFKTTMTKSSFYSVSVKNNLLAYGGTSQIHLLDMNTNTIMRNFKHENCTESCWRSTVKIVDGNLITFGYDSAGLIDQIN